jgi:hypothetical protein
MKTHEHKWVSIRKGFPQKLCMCGMLKVGTHTVLLGDEIRYTSTKLPVGAGQLGMDLATGRAQQFVGGSAEAIANLSDIPGGAPFSAGAAIPGTGFPLVGDTVLYTITPAAGDYLFTFCTQWQQGGGPNFVAVDVRINATPLVGYTTNLVFSASQPFLTAIFTGKVTLGGADALSLVAGPAANPGLTMDSGSSSILKVG